MLSEIEKQELFLMKDTVTGLIDDWLFDCILSSDLDRFERFVLNMRGYMKDEGDRLRSQRNGSESDEKTA